MVIQPLKGGQGFGQRGWVSSTLMPLCVQPACNISTLFIITKLEVTSWIGLFNLNMGKPVKRYSCRVAPAASLISIRSIPCCRQPHNLHDPLPKPACPIIWTLVLSSQPCAQRDHHIGVCDITPAFFCDLWNVLERERLSLRPNLV